MPWRGHDDIAHLVLGEQVPTDASVVESCLRSLQRAGYCSVVTSALAPADSLPFVDAGFEVRERLHLLEHDLEGLPDGDGRRRARRAWRTDRSQVLELDRLAFDRFWRLEEPGLREALHATPAVRFRVGDFDESPSGTGRSGIAAYAITGRAGRRGYLQRVAVHPDGRRSGWWSSLVIDALRWLRRHDVHRALVNTQWANDGALALYESCGFRRLPVGLCVLDRRL